MLDGWSERHTWGVTFFVTSLGSIVYFIDGTPLAGFFLATTALIALIRALGKWPTGDESQQGWPR